MSDIRPSEPAAQTPTNNGHDANGRFAKGNPGGPGNPFARQVAALRKVIINRLTEEDLLAITEALLAKAKEGSVGAAKLLLGYAIGKPASAPDPDRLDGQELKHFKDQVETVNEVHELAVEVGRAVDRRPGPAGLSDDYSALMQEMVRYSEKYDNPVRVQAVANDGRQLRGLPTVGFDRKNQRHGQVEAFAHSARIRGGAPVRSFLQVDRP